LISAAVSYQTLTIWLTGIRPKTSLQLHLLPERAIGHPFTYGFLPNSIDGTGQQVSLAYIPKTSETVNFFSDVVGGATAAQQAATFDNYINGNKYLNSRRGKFTERNAAFTPWNNNLDFRFSQDFKFGNGKHKQVITFTYDIVNLTNLLNKNWGQYYFSANTFNSTSSVGLTPKTTPAFAAQVQLIKVHLC